MKQLRRLLYVLIHFTFWGIPILILELLGEEKNVGIFNSGDFGFFFPIYYGVGLSAAFFYACVYWIMPYFLKNKGAWYAFLGAFGAYILHSTIESGLDILVAESRGLLSDTELLFYAIAGNFIVNLIVFFLAVGYFFLENLILSERRELKIREEKLQLEIDILRAQLNPHFMFNVLNNLFGTARKNGCEETAIGIVQLSGLMRYMLQESNQNFVLLQNELAYLENYIKLQQLRFSTDDDIRISFTIEGDLENRYIAPLILITFVENAFMHGINIKSSCYIDIGLKTEKNGIFFTVVNRDFGAYSKDIKSNGIGIANTRKRLDLIYQHKYSLEIGKSQSAFLVELFICDKL